MKNLITIVLILSIAVVYGQPKQVHLIHGHNGNGNSWEELQSTFSENCPDITAHKYDLQVESTSGLDIYSKALESELETNNSTSNDIAICHSFGGGAIKDLDNTDKTNIGGYITVASPHGGAQLASSVINDKYPRIPSLRFYLKSGCEEVAEDVVKAFLPVSPALKALELFKGNAMQMLLCDCSWFYLLATEGVASFYGNGETVKDLAKGGKMSLLDPPSKPSVGIQAVLSSPVHWNLLEYFINDPRASGGGGMSGEYECYNELTGFFYDASETFIENIPLGKIWGFAKKIYILDDILGVFFPNKKSLPEKMDGVERWMYVGSNYYNINKWVMPLMYAKFNKIARELEQGAQWIDFSEQGYERVIGSGGGAVINTYTEDEWVYLCNCWCKGEAIPCDVTIADAMGCDGMMPPVPDYCSPNPDPGCWSLEEVTKYNITYVPSEPSDGVVPLSDQILDGALRNVLVEDSKPSHFAEPKDKGVWSVIQSQIDLNIAADPVFVLDNCIIQ